MDASVAQAVEARLAEVEQTVQRVPEMAVENISGSAGQLQLGGTFRF